MALNFKTINYNSNAFIERFDSKYFILQEFLDNKNNNLNLISLEGLIDSITDGEHAGQNFVKKGILFLKNSSIKDYDISLDDGFYITEKKHKKLSRSALKAEDVLFTTIGHLGSAAIVPENFGEANMNQNFVKMRIKKEKISPYYLVAFLNNKLARLQIKSLLTGNIQSILTYPKIKKIEILIPSNKDDELDIENKYKEAIRLGKEARNIIKNTIVFLDNELELINKEENFKNTFAIEFDQLSNESELWTPKYFCPKYVKTEEGLKNTVKCTKLGMIAELKKGDEPGSDLYIDYLDKKDSDVPFIRTSDIYNYQIDTSPDNFIDEISYNEIAQDIKNGDILFTKDGKIGEIAMVTESDKAIYSSGVDRIRINENGISLGLTSEYIFNIISCNKVGKYTAERYTVVASTIPHLKEEFMKKMVIPILDKSIIDEITVNTKKAFKMIDKKKKLILECQKKIDDMIKLAN